MIHVLNPISGQELEGWPVDMNYNSLSGPVTADLDNDGDLEVIAAMKSGTVFVLHHDGTPFNGFPANVSGTIESSPAIGDLDSDGNYELIFGTTQGLQVFDIKSDKGEVLSWKMHRGNIFRNGTYGLSLLSVNPEESILPDKFFVSPNYPNPFNPSTNIDIHIDLEAKLNVSIFDAKGRLVNTLMNKNQTPGFYSLRWAGKDKNGKDVPTGVYFIQVKSGHNMDTQKVALIK
jgi:hypothetical protein